MSLIRLPSLVDIHVHLRDPGATQKEDFRSGTNAALAGGISTVFDMPNNPLPTFTEDALNEKMNIAQNKAVCNWGLYFGTDGKNTEMFEKVYGNVVGLKLYLNMTTGKFLIEDKNLIERVFKTWPRGKPIVVHAEGDMIDHALKLGVDCRQNIHIAHVSTRDMLVKILEIRKMRELKTIITCEVTPHHLFLTAVDSDRLGPFGEMKPMLASKKDQHFLWEHLENIDCIASDHAPHTKEEKNSKEHYYGVPGVETMVPLLLTAMNKKQITKRMIIRMLHTNPHRIFNIKPDPATYAEVDPQAEWVIHARDLKTKCGWTPYEGMTAVGKVVRTVVKGQERFAMGKSGKI